MLNRERLFQEVAAINRCSLSMLINECQTVFFANVKTELVFEILRRNKSDWR